MDSCTNHEFFGGVCQNLAKASRSIDIVPVDSASKTREILFCDLASDGFAGAHQLARSDLVACIAIEMASVLSNGGMPAKWVRIARKITSRFCRPSPLVSPVSARIYGEVIVRPILSLP